MAFFRLLLVAMFVSLAAYTAITIGDHGTNLFPDFFGDMRAMGWPGQFNFDFMLMLLLSGLWVMWRHQFSAGGIGLGMIAFFGGALFLSAYLFVQSFRTEGDVRRLFIGDR